MPDDSCRTCGGELVRHSRCSECRKIIQKMCTVCNLKTHKEFHFKCMNLELYQIGSEKIHATVQNVIYRTPEIKKTAKKNISNKISMLLGVIVIAMAGLAFGNYVAPTLSHLLPTEISNDGIPSIKDDQIHPIKANSQISTSNVMPEQDLHIITSSSFKAQYIHCLGVSDGNSLTINCPTDYGIVYKAIVGIPADLVSQFESKVFYMRNFSVLENSNNLLIEYKKQTYITTFVVH